MVEVDVPEKVRKNLSKEEKQQLESFESKAENASSNRRVENAVEKLESALEKSFEKTSAAAQQKSSGGAVSKFSQIQDIREEKIREARRKINRTDNAPDVANQLPRIAENFTTADKAESLASRITGSGRQQDIVNAAGDEIDFDERQNRLENRREKQRQERADQLAEGSLNDLRDAGILTGGESPTQIDQVRAALEKEGLQAAVDTRNKVVRKKAEQDFQRERERLQSTRETIESSSASISEKQDALQKRADIVGGSQGQKLDELANATINQRNLQTTDFKQLDKNKSNPKQLGGESGDVADLFVDATQRFNRNQRLEQKINQASEEQRQRQSRENVFFGPEPTTAGLSLPETVPADALVAPPTAEERQASRQLQDISQRKTARSFDVTEQPLIGPAVKNPAELGLQVKEGAEDLGISENQARAFGVTTAAAGNLANAPAGLATLTEEAIKDGPGEAQKTLEKGLESETRAIQFGQGRVTGVQRFLPEGAEERQKAELRAEASQAGFVLGSLALPAQGIASGGAVSGVTSPGRIGIQKPVRASLPDQPDEFVGGRPRNLEDTELSLQSPLVRPSKAAKQRNSDLEFQVQDAGDFRRARSENVRSGRQDSPTDQPELDIQGSDPLVGGGGQTFGISGETETIFQSDQPILVGIGRNPDTGEIEDVVAGSATATGVADESSATGVAEATAIRQADPETETSLQVQSPVKKGDGVEIQKPISRVEEEQDPEVGRTLSDFEIRQEILDRETRLNVVTEEGERRVTEELSVGVEGRVGPQEFTGLSQVDRTSRTGTGSIFRAESALGSDSLATDQVTSQGAFLDEQFLKNLDNPSDTTVDFDERISQPFKDKEITEEQLKQLRSETRELFGTDASNFFERLDELEGDQRSSFDEPDTRDRDTDTGQELQQFDVKETDQRVGVGTDQVNVEAFRQAAEDLNNIDSFPSETGRITGPAVSTAEGAATGTDVSSDTGLAEENIEDNILREEQDQRQKDIQGNRQEKINFINEDLGIIQATSQDLDLDQDQTQKQQQETFFQSTPTKTPGFRNPRSGPPPAGGLPPKPDSGEDDQDSGLLGLIAPSKDTDIKRSVAADLIDLEEADVSKTQAQNPLSLRPI